jgi:hypothetical protein
LIITVRELHLFPSSGVREETFLLSWVRQTAPVSVGGCNIPTGIGSAGDNFSILLKEVVMA